MWLFERPFAICLAGAVCAAVTAFFWLQTRHRRLFHLFVLIILAAGCLLAVERIVKTDKEQIAAVIHRVAALVLEGKYDDAVEHIHGSEPVAKREALRVLEACQFDDVRIKRNLEITVDSHQEPRVAKATFNVVAVLGRDVRGAKAGRPIPRFLVVEFQREADRWYVTKYSHDSPMVGYQTDRHRNASAEQVVPSPTSLP